MIAYKDKETKNEEGKEVWGGFRGQSCLWQPQACTTQRRAGSAEWRPVTASLVPQHGCWGHASPRLSQPMTEQHEHNTESSHSCPITDSYCPQRLPKKCTEVWRFFHLTLFLPLSFHKCQLSSPSSVTLSTLPSYHSLVKPPSSNLLYVWPVECS